jgi:hypothetical protein
MGKPGDEARMAKMRARRAPFTDPRDGRLRSQVRFAFCMSGGKPLTTTEFLSTPPPPLEIEGPEITQRQLRIDGGRGDHDRRLCRF